MRYLKHQSENKLGNNTQKCAVSTSKLKLKQKFSTDARKLNRNLQVLAQNNENHLNESLATNHYSQNNQKYDPIGRKIHFYRKPWESATPPLFFSVKSPDRSPESQQKYRTMTAAVEATSFARKGQGNASHPQNNSAVPSTTTAPLTTTLIKKEDILKKLEDKTKFIQEYDHLIPKNVQKKLRDEINKEYKEWTEGLIV